MKIVFIAVAVLLSTASHAQVKEGVSGTYAIAQECGFTADEKRIMSEKIMRTSKLTPAQLQQSAQHNWQAALSSVQATRRSQSAAEWEDFCGGTKFMLLMDERM